ncbi:MAG TPA: di-heme oxidoredictase family protein, partial [Bryobacteraceae bacterium]|nr:di-heme oxidoredictase family protein [Bryobacteraceae bacterium]
MANHKRRFVVIFAGLLTTAAQAQPGPPPPPPPNGSAPQAGQPLPGLTASELAYFMEGARRFREVDSVSGTQPGAPGPGLGPRFNLNSCVGCHAQPGPGGSSPRVNPQIPVATEFGAQNTIPSFIHQNGPVRVVRFRRNPDGTPDGGVHNLFVISGRSDAAGCAIVQPDFAAAVARNNVSFRIPTPIFGAGLVESIPDAAILFNLSDNGALKAQLGIGGHVNRNGNDGTVTRYGWKAQNKSPLLFAGEAYNVEQGVTNELFPTERDETPGCVFNPSPEDSTNLTAATATASMSDLVAFAEFMRYLAPPNPGPPTASSQRGSQVFAEIGCVLCHTQTLQTGNTASQALANKPARLYSDLALHNMGQGLNDGIAQGLAQGGDWRTAPLWGVGQRLFYLHDGRASDLG